LPVLEQTTETNMASSSGAKARARAAKVKEAGSASAEAGGEVPEAGPEAAEAGAEGNGARSGSTLRKKSLVDAVAKSTGAKKKVAKEVVDAVLAELGAAIGRGDDLVLPPLGRGRVLRQRDTGGGEVIVLRFRRGGGKDAGAEGEAEADAGDDAAAG
jgi:DNA-binding protein HU-alpha